MVTYPKDWIEGKLTDYLRPVPFFKYLKEPNIVGLYPVIQQGEIPIVGFSNGSAYENFSNIILFGDHTLSLYKPTKKFFVATDGVKILDCKGIDRDFAYYWLSNNMPKSEGYKRHFSIIKNLALTIPHSVGEQQAIADTLSTFDEHIDNLTELIEKKKAIRDGALEDLATGKVRLEGFNGEWDVTRLGNIVKVKRGKRVVRRELSERGNIPVFQNSLDPLGYFTQANCPANSTIVIAAGNAGDIGFCNCDFWAADDCYYFEGQKSINQKFLYYCLLFNKSYISSQSRRTSIPRLSRDVLEKIELSLPVLVNEQQAIASVLTAMDEELDNLEREKEKILQMKAGAMDDLLTGKIRLV